MIDRVHWSEWLEEQAAELDLADPEDRAIFRLKVAQAMKLTKVWALRERAVALGVAPKGQSRDAAVRAFAQVQIDKVLKEQA